MRKIPYFRAAALCAIVSTLAFVLLDRKEPVESSDEVGVAAGENSKGKIEELHSGRATESAREGLGSGKSEGFEEDLQSELDVAQGDADTSSSFVHSGVWKNPEVISVTHFETEDPKTTRIVTLLQPVSVPYPVRIEEFRDERGNVISRSEMVADRFIVRLNSPEQKSLAQELVDRMGAEIQVISQMIDLYTINLPELTPDGVPKAVVEMSAYDELFAYAEPDDIVRLLATPDDPQYTNGALWGMHNTGQTGDVLDRDAGSITVPGTVDADIDAPEGWDIRTDAPNVIVGVIDSGVRYTHEDIAANMWINSGEDGLDSFGNSKRTNGVDDDGNGWVDDVFGIDALNQDGDPMDDNSHGTHVAGTVGAIGNNGKGVVGVAWQTQIMALKFLSAEGGGALADSIQCIEYAIQNGASITNNSWGGGLRREALKDMIKAAGDADQLFVAAAGNNATDIDVVDTYPASYQLENILPVAATARTDGTAWFTNTGSGTVGIAAPGDNIISLSHADDTGVTVKSGTSMAAPAVAGLAALLFEEFSSSDAIGIKNRILSSRRQVPALNNVVLSGGIINVYDALQTTNDAPLNDDFADALIIQDDPETILTTNRHATAETGEPSHASLGTNSVWFKIEAANNARLSFSTEGSDFDTVMAAYTGASVDALSLITSSDDTESETYSSLQIDVTAGTDYYVAVAGKAGAEGFLKLSLVGPPASDSLADAKAIESLPFFELSDNSLATEEPNEPDHASGGGDRSIWFTLNLGDFGDSTKEIVLSTLGSEFDSVISIYTSTEADPGFSDLVLFTENDDAPYGDTYSEVSFLADASTTYWIAVDSKLNGGSGAMRLLGNPKTFNDDFEDAAAIFGDRTSTSFTATDFERATREFGEPNHDNAGGTGSLWYKWSPDTDGDYRIETNAATAMGVYTGSSVNALSLVAGDQSEGSASLAVVESASSATEYFIAIDNRGGAGTSNDIVISVKPFTQVENDGWENADTVSATPTAQTSVTIQVDNENASRETGEPGASVFASVWYQWVATETGNFRLDALGDVNTNTELAVYSVSSNPSDFNDFTLISEDSDSGVSTNALVTFSAVSGTSYYFQVGTADAGQAGAFELVFSPFAAPANDDLVNAEAVTDFFVQREVTYLGATREASEPMHTPDNDHWNPDTMPSPASDTAYYTLWYKWTPADASEARRTAASSFGSGANTIVAVYETTVANPTYGDLTQVAPPSSDWSNLWSWGEVVWDAELGKDYYIVFGNQSSATNYELYRVSITQNANDDSSGATVLPSTGNLSVVDSNFAASYNSGDSNHIEGGARTLWYEWTAPADGIYSIDTYGSGLNTTETLMGADLNRQEEGGRVNIVLLRKVAPGAYVPFGSFYGFFVSDFDYNTLMAFDVTAGTTLAFILDSPNPDGVVTDADENAHSYRSVIQFNLSSGAPANDDFANAEVITGDYYQQTVDMRHASFEDDEPTHSGGDQRSLWWKWTAPDSDTYNAYTNGDIFDSQINGPQAIAVYSGPSSNATFDDLTLVLGNKRGNSSYLPAGGSFSTTAGQTYYIAVAAGGAVQGYSGFKTGLMLGKTAVNDDFANAEDIVGSIATISSHNLGSTWEDPDEPQLDAGDVDSRQASVWWRWVAPASGLTTLTTEKSLLENELGVFTGSSLDNLTLVAKEVPSQSFRDEETYEERVSTGTGAVSFGATAGETYYFNVSGSGGTRSYGPITLELVGQPGVPFDPTNVDSTRVSATRVDVTWTDNAVDETNYAIERSATDSGPWQEVFRSSDANVTSWSDLAADADYYYRVRAEGRGGESAWVVLTPFIFTIQATETDPGEVTLTWPDAETETSYQVSLRLNGATDWIVVDGSVSANATTKVLTSLLRGGSYVFRVEALNGATVTYQDTETLSLEAAFLQSSTGPEYLVVIEAERFAASDSGTTGTHTWELSASTGAGGDGAMFLGPDNASSWITDSVDVATAAPEMSYQVNFNQTGTHYLWVRAKRADDGSDSLHAGINDSLLASATLIERRTAADGWTADVAEWNWLGALRGGTRISVDVPSTGVHTINIWGREDGILVDRLILTPDSTFTPNDTETESGGHPNSPSGLSAIEDWRRTHFGVTNEIGVSANNVANRGDGVPNYARFALGGTPFSDSKDILPNVSRATESNETYFEFTYRRREGTGTGSTEAGYTVDGFTYIVEVRGDLGSGSWMSGPSMLSEQSSSSNGDGTMDVKVRVVEPISDNDNMFIRLRIAEE